MTLLRPFRLMGIRSRRVPGSGYMAGIATRARLRPSDQMFRKGMLMFSYPGIDLRRAWTVTDRNRIQHFHLQHPWVQHLKAPLLRHILHLCRPNRSVQIARMLVLFILTQFSVGIGQKELRYGNIHLIDSGFTVCHNNESNSIWLEGIRGLNSSIHGSASGSSGVDQVATGCGEMHPAAALFISVSTPRTKTLS